MQKKLKKKKKKQKALRKRNKIEIEIVAKIIAKDVCCLELSLWSSTTESRITAHIYTEEDVAAKKKHTTTNRTLH